MEPILRTYDFQDQVRDVSESFIAIAQSAPTILSLISFGGVANNHKHEWTEDTMKPQMDTLNGAVLVGAGSAVVDNPSRFWVHDIWVNVDTDERVRVTAVNEGTSTITITRAVGGVAQAMADGAELRLVSRPQKEGSDPQASLGTQPTMEYNFTQIFDRTAQVSRSAEGTRRYGVESQFDRAVRVKLDEINREMAATVLYGVKQERVSDAVRGQMGGLYQFLDQNGAMQIDAAGGALSKTLMSNALERTFNWGAADMVALCHTSQARKISGFDANYEVVRSDRTTGKVIYEFQGDIAGNPQGPAKIVVDPNYSRKRLDFVNAARLQVVPFVNGSFRDFDATPNGADYFARRILGEYTMEVRNAKEAHVSIVNLAP